MSKNMWASPRDNGNTLCEDCGLQALNNPIDVMIRGYAYESIEEAITKLGELAPGEVLLEEATGPCLHCGATNEEEEEVSA